MFENIPCNLTAMGCLCEDNHMSGPSHVNFLGSSSSYGASVQEKSGVIEQLEREKQRKGEQVQQAQAELARQAALIRDLQAHPKGKPHPKEPAVPPEQVCCFCQNLHEEL